MIFIVFEHAHYPSNLATFLWLLSTCIGSCAFIRIWLIGGSTLKTQAMCQWKEMDIYPSFRENC